jgi:hypothetical protein
VAEAGVLAEDLGGQLVHVHPVGQRDVMRSVGRGDGVARAEMGADADGRRLPAGRGCISPGTGPAAMSKAGVLPSK